MFYALLKKSINRLSERERERDLKLKQMLLIAFYQRELVISTFAFSVFREVIYKNATRLM